MHDAVPMFERWKWTLPNVEALDWSDFEMLADAVADINQREAEAFKNANKPQR